MIILGISHLEPSPFGHDSTVAILENGVLKAAISEERFSRIKHDGGFLEEFEDPKWFKIYLDINI